MPKIGYSYLRFSTRDQAKGHSLERQLEDTENWCKRNGVVLDRSRSLRDLGVTGFTGIHRDNPDKYALAHFVEQVQTGEIAPDCYLIIENLDRLTREDVRTATMFFLTLLELQVNIVTTSPERVYRHDSKDMVDIIAAVLELSRGHGESARKSIMVGKAWRAKKADAVKDKKPLSAMCPHWLKVVEGCYVPIPERVKVVQRIFREASAIGVGALCRKLNKEGVKPFGGVRRKGDEGKPHLWQKSSLARLLGNRAVLGEYQPHMGHRNRTAVGDPVIGFYPAVITEREFYEAKAALEARRKVGVVERSVGTNLFSGLVRAEDGCSWIYHNKGKTQDSTLARSDSLTGGKAYTAVSYRVFEQVVLESLREISPAELTPGEKRGEAERVAEIKAKLVAVDEKVQTFEQRIYQDPKNETWPRLLDKAKAEKEQLQTAYQEARRALSAPVVEGVAEAQTLIGMLKADDSPALRKKLRAKIAAVVPTILFTLFQRPGWRCGWIQIHFRYSDYVRNILFTHLVRRKSRNFERPEVVSVELVHEPPVKDAKFNGRLMEQLHDVSQFEALVATGDKAKIEAELDRLDEKYGIRQDMLKRGYVPNTPEEAKKVKKSRARPKA
ncbi:recombinase family protein [bacterium]|nr:recombinase family protein [bacterium]